MDVVVVIVTVVVDDDVVVVTNLRPISPTFYEQLFLQENVFGFIIFWQNNIGAKAARKILAKLALEVNVTIISC